MQQVLLYMKDSNMYCMVSFADKNGKSHGDHPQILEIQGVVWFATEDLAFQYYMFLKPELREEYVYPVEERDLPSFENVKPEDIQIAKYKNPAQKSVMPNMLPLS